MLGTSSISEEPQLIYCCSCENTMSNAKHSCHPHMPICSYIPCRQIASLTLEERSSKENEKKRIRRKSTVVHYVVNIVLAVMSSYVASCKPALRVCAKRKPRSEAVSRGAPRAAISYPSRDPTSCAPP